MSLGRWAGNPAFLHCRVFRVRVNVRRSIIFSGFMNPPRDEMKLGVSS